MTRKEAKKYVGKLVEVYGHDLGILQNILKNEQFPYLVTFRLISAGSYDYGQFASFTPIYRDDPRLSDREW